MRSHLSRAAIALLTFAALVGCAGSRRIVVRSDPPGARVVDTITGREFGTTELTLDISRKDSLHLSFEKKGRMSATQDVAAGDENLTLMVELPKLATRLTVRTIPVGANLEFTDSSGNRVKSNVVPKVAGSNDPSNAVYEIAEGVSQISIHMAKAGYATKIAEVTVEPGVDNVFTFTLDKLSAALNIVTEPSGAEIYEKALGYLGNSPLDRDLNWEELRRLSTSRDVDTTTAVVLQLTIRKTGYRTEERVLTLDLGRPNDQIAVQLSEDASARVRIDSEPHAVEVFEKTLGRLGDTPLERQLGVNDIRRLDRGRDGAGRGGFVTLHLVFRKDRYQPIETSRIIPLDGSTTEVRIRLEAATEAQGKEQ